MRKVLIFSDKKGLGTDLRVLLGPGFFVMQVSKLNQAREQLEPFSPNFFIVDCEDPEESIVKSKLLSGKVIADASDKLPFRLKLVLVSNLSEERLAKLYLESYSGDLNDLKAQILPFDVEVIAQHLLSAQSC